MRSRSYRAVASRFSAGDALHCSLLTACDARAGARAPQRLRSYFCGTGSPETYRTLQWYYKSHSSGRLWLLVSYRPLAHDSCRPALQSIAAITDAQQPSGTASIAPAPRALRTRRQRELCTAALHALLPGALVVRCSGDRFCAADGVFEQ